MPYPPEHKARTRARIVEKARVLFNHRGFEQVTIDAVMKEAGLTRGGFYHHFRNKDELYSEAVRSFSTCNPFVVRRAALREQPTAQGLADMLVKLYLSDEVLDNVDLHCPLIALPSDVARSGLVPRAAYTDIVRNMLRVFQAALAPLGAAAADKARVVLSLCVGSMVIARTTTDPELRTSVRSAVRRHALAVLASAEALTPVARAPRDARKPESKRRASRARPRPNER
jgi:TetR/AcrR family transcriptional regulator, transcriptional repressor for nem operon